MLADGRFRSGSEIGARLGVSRAAVRKAVVTLRRQGLVVYAVRGRGYCLARPAEPLDAARIRAACRTGGLLAGDRLRVLEEIDSTSSYLMRLGEAGVFCLAEQQGAGRGRLGRRWEAPPYRNVLLSMSWRFAAGAQSLAGLSLAAGVAAARALRGAGYPGVGLKWPNDVVAGGRKLGGVLVEVRGEAGGPCLAVIGLGLNLDLDADPLPEDRTDLRTLGGSVPARNPLCAALIDALAAVCREFELRGYAAFQAEWEELHAYAGQPVQLVTPLVTVQGLALGSDPRGALRVRHADGSIGVYDSGEISLRAVA